MNASFVTLKVVFEEIIDCIFVILHGEWLEGFAFGNTKLPHYQLLPTFVLYLDPQLKLLHKLLAEDGAIFISIDDNEQANLKLVMDEIFGANNFLANVAWEKRFTRSNNAKLFYSVKDSILIYRKSPGLSYIREGRTEKADSNYSNPDDDPRGPWMTSSYVNPATKALRPNLAYDLENPVTKQKLTHPTHAWKYKKSEYLRHVKENRLFWGTEGGYTFPRLKNYLEEAKGMVPVDYWSYKEVGTTDDGGKTLNELFGGKGAFDTPKPTALIEKIIKMTCGDEDIILDSFAGSGTTAHAVLNLNQQDGGNRQFILVEMEDYAETITAERVRRVMNGYTDKPGTGGQFTYCTLGEPLFDNEGNLNPAVPVAKIREYIWFTETRQSTSPLPLGEGLGVGYLLGLYDDTAYYFCYEPNAGTVLNMALLTGIRQRAGQYIVYADACTLPDEFLALHRIIFKKIPRDINRL